MANEGGKSAGIGFPSALFLTFLVLKLCGVIDWSWWWITAPLWGAFCLAFSLCIGVVVIAVWTGKFK